MSAANNLTSTAPPKGATHRYKKRWVKDVSRGRSNLIARFYRDKDNRWGDQRFAVFEDELQALSGGASAP